MHDMSLTRRGMLKAGAMALAGAALGPASSVKHAEVAKAPFSIPMWWLFGLLAASLLAEWASRRLRGVR